MKINKKVALSFLTIAGTLTAVVGITLAQFSNSVSLTGNTLSTASATLGIGTGECASTTDSITGVTTSNVTPGGSGSKTFCLKNNGGVALTINALANVTSGNLDPNMVEVKVNCGSGDVLVMLNGSSSDDIVTISAGGTASCTITQMLKSTATNSAANKTISYDVTFTGTP